MNAYLWPLFSCRLYTEIIRLKKFKHHCCYIYTYTYIYIYEVHAISSKTFFVWAFKFVRLLKIQYVIAIQHILNIRGAFNKFPDFFVQAFKIVVNSRKFNMLLRYILWDDWRIFMISGLNEQLLLELEYTLQVNFKNVIWHLWRTICNKILF